MNDLTELACHDRPVYCILIMKTEKKPTRTSLPKSALARLYLIDQQIASGKKPNAKQLVDYRAENSGSYFGVFSGQKKQRFKIVFYYYSAAWVKDRKWADDQKITETDAGLVISFSSTQFTKVAEWVLSHGCTARPLEPELLVNHWYNVINEMKKLAGKK